MTLAYVRLVSVKDCKIKLSYSVGAGVNLTIEGIGDRARRIGRSNEEATASNSSCERISVDRTDGPVSQVRVSGDTEAEGELGSSSSIIIAILSNTELVAATN